MMILKSKISPTQKMAIQKMPMMLDDGGDVESSNSEQAVSQADSASDQSQRSPVSADRFADADQGSAQATVPSDQVGSYTFDPTSGTAKGPGSQYDSTATDATPNGSAAVQPGGEFSSSNQAQPNQQQGAAIAPQGSDVVSAVNQGAKGIKEQRNYAEQLAANQAKIEQDQLDARAQVQKDAADNLKGFVQHQQEFRDYIANNPINPKEYQENMSTGQKVSTAIGLFLGGLGGGLNKTGVNPAADFLNKQIDRDIQGQKDRMDQQKTLLGANQELYHDQTLATNQTTINLRDNYLNQMKLAADKLGTPAAQAAYDQQKADWDLKNAGLLRQNALYMTAVNALKQGGGAGLDPITLGQAGLIPPEEAQKEQAAFDTHKAGVQRINDLYAQANKEQTGANLLNPQSHFRIDAINSQLIDNFMAMDTAKRYSAESAKALLKPNLISTFDNQATRIQKQNNILEKAQAEASGSMPYFSRVAPKALPNYAIPKPSYQPGQKVFVNGQQGVVGSDGKIRAI